MKQAIRPRFLWNVRKIRKHPVKQTALLYLREALRRERYEQCAEFISVAREFGAQEFEITDLLEDFRRIPKG